MRAAAATILRVVSILFLSRLISLYLLILIQEQKKTEMMPRIVVAKVHQGEWRRLDRGDGGGRLEGRPKREKYTVTVAVVSTN